MQRGFWDDFDSEDVEREIQLRESDAVTLRPYQREAVDAVFERWEAGDVATLLVLATGLGKTICFSEVMRRWEETAA